MFVDLMSELFIRYGLLHCLVFGWLMRCSMTIIVFNPIIERYLINK